MDAPKLEKEATKWAIDTNNDIDEAVSAWYAAYSYILSLTENTSIEIPQKELYIRLLQSLVL